MNINRIFRNLMSYKINKSALLVFFLFAALMLLKSYPVLSEPGKSLIGVESCQEYPEAVIKHDIDRKKPITGQDSNKLHENVTNKEKKQSGQRRCGDFLSKRSAIGKNDSDEKPKIPQLYENSHKDDNQNTPPLILSRGTELLGLLNSDPKKLAQDYVVNKLNSQITNNTQKWLSQFGTAKINLNIDHHGHLDESSVDLLVPFYDDKDHWLVYSQYGYRHKDSRDTVNLGVGTRLFINNWMYGANTFYDNDLTGNNSRFSLGGELWTNYLKMSANAYFRLSDWHNSRDLANYYERPANGYDLIADMYLPSMPSLGAKIKYEQYFGDNVALFGTNNRQKDPYAATIGVNYTPVPLITAGVDYKLGKEGKSDGIFSLNVNYRFGVPLSEQLSPENVSSLRSLAGSRYDLVERNNNIILNYLKKQQHFRLLVPVIEIGGYGGEIKPIQIQSDTPFKNVTWDLPELFQKNGGIINVESTHGYTIQLPEYQPDGKNDYTITGTIKDVQQNVQIQIHVLQRNISLSVNTTDPLIADGNAKYVYTATLLGADKKTPIENAKLVWDTDKKDPGLKLKPDSEATDKNGQQTATLTSTTPLSDIQVSVSINGERITTDKKVSFTETSSSYRVSRVTVDKDSGLYNNGADSYTFTATVVDAHGKPVADKPIDIEWQTEPTEAGLKLTKQSSPVSNAQGQVTATLTSTVVVKDVQVSAKTVSQPTAVNADKKVSFAELSDSYRVTGVTVEVDKDKVRYNNGADSYTFTATVKDGHGNLVVDQPVEIDWQTDPAVAGLKLTKQSNSVSNAQGQVTATLTSTAAVADVQVSAKTASQQTAVKAASKVSFVELSTSYYVASVAVDVDKDEKRYNNGADSYTFTATVKDGHGNLVVDQPVEIDWQTDPAVAGLKLTKQSNSVSNAQGQVTATLTSTAAVTDVQVSAKTASQQTAVKAASKVSFVELSTSYYVASVTVEVDKDKVRYNNGADSYTFTATVKDGHGNLVVDQPVEIDWQTDPAVAGLKLTKQSNSVSNAQGQVTATLTSTAAVTDVQVSAKTASQQTAVKAASKVSFVELSTSYYVASVAVDVDKDEKRYNNGADSYTFTATVKDGHGNLVVDQPVEIDWQTDPAVAGLKLTKQSNSVSNAQGQVTATLTSTAAVKDVQVSAKTASQQTAVKAESKVSFVELSTSYYVASVAVDVDKDEKRYNNGTDSYTFTATVKDGHGNLVVDQPVEIDWQTDPAVAGLKLTKQSNSVSNAQGQVTATLTSTAAVTDVQVSAKTASQQTAVKAASKVSFVELSTSYYVASVAVDVDKDEKRYNNGTDSYTFTATVKDGHGNLVVDQPVEIDWQTDPAVAGLKLTKQSNSVSNAQGQVTATLTSTAAVTDVQVSAKTASQQTAVKAASKVSFVELSTSYYVASVAVDVDKDEKRYNNGTDSYTFTATVKDGHGNLVVDQPVEIDWQTDPAVAGLKLTKQSNSVSNAQGQVTATLTSTAAVTDVQVSAKTASQQTAVKAASKVSFVELSTSYYVASVAVDVDKDEKRYNNGADTYTFTATVKDGHGNLVVDQPVEIDWQTDPAVAGLKLTKQSNSVSNAQGQVTATLTSTAAVTDVQVSAKTASQQTAVKAASKVSFVELSTSYYVASVAVDVDKDKDEKRYNNGADSYTFTATVKDGHGNLVVDQPVEIDWQTEPTEAGLTLTKQSNPVSNAQGQVTATLTSTAAVKDVRVSAKAAANPSWVEADRKVSFEDLSTSYHVTRVTVDKEGPLYNEGTDAYTFTATVEDAYGNLVVDKPIDIDWQTDPAVDGLTLTKQSNPVSNAQGQVTATLSSTVVAIDVQVSAKTATQQTPVKVDKKISFISPDELASLTVSPDHVTEGEGEGHTYTFTATVKDFSGQAKSGVTVAWSATNSKGVTITDKNLVTQVVGDGKTDADGKAQYQIYSKSGGFVAVMVTAKVNDSSVGSKNKTVEIKANEQDVTGFFILDYDPVDGKGYGNSVPKERMNFAWPKMQFVPEYLPGKLTIAGYTGVYDSNNRNIVDVDGEYFRVKKTGTVTLTATFTHPISGRYLKYVIPDVKIDHFVIIDSNPGGPGIGIVFSGDRIDNSKPLPRCTRGNRIQESDLGESIDYLVNNLNLNLIEKGLLGDPRRGLNPNGVRMGGLQKNETSIQAHFLDNNVRNALAYNSLAYVVLCEE
ncbi:Ig-like domain-containing protein [Photorhabdus luminescens]|nr:Ig-like domain-containing protein [Photorhabdus luminescens]